MNNKKVQKLNRAAVAAVLAASGAAVTMPYSVVKADSPFSDVTTSNSHYDSIMKLYNRGIISGFEDKTFRPSKEVTRGQAAKMLALTLGLDIYNVKNPKFKDVPTTSGYYPYIAALVEQGVISGYVDNTFRPGEVITRNQMAKIIVKGFQFGETKNLTHKFEDVSSKNANRFYIQTLVNLGITTGTSAITFSPNKAVTRAQLSSFLIRAEEANVYGAKVKEITKIEQTSGVTYIYLNGVKHTVNASLRDILNVKNTETLKGAYIEGTIVGSEIRTLNKITFNAVGAQNNVLTFDGNGSTYRGAVEITGNHLRFANWTVTGEVKIAPIQTQAFSNLYKPLTVKTIASLKVASDLIDWGSQTPPSQLEPGENDGGLIEIPPDNKPVLPKMKTVEHDIQFTNVKMRALVITANRTKVRSNVDLAHVTVGGYVREFELHTDVNELYIESDDNVTFYGVADIEKLYKNSYKSLNLYADSVTQLIAVDNASGWIDLGDYYYVDKFIIPPNKLPHDIFNDFINDSDKIGNITDPGGTEVDRDPIENGIVPDWEPPVLTIKNAQTNLATVNVTVNSNEDGIVHYLVKREKDGEPSIREIMQYTGNMGGTKAVSEGQDAIITVTDLKDQEKYIIYAVAVDEAGNVSKKVSEAFEIVDATPPNIEPAEAVGLPGGKRIEVSMKPNEAGTYYYYYEPLLSLGANDYTPEEIKEYGKMNYRNQAGKGTVDEAGEMKFRIEGLAPLTDYVVYVVMEDEYGNLMTEAKVMQATTTELDDVYPYVTDGQLHPVRNDFYEFEINVNEALNPVSANNLDNYELSGTAILNVNGQPTTIKPDKVTYVEGSKKIQIRVPSATALVNGDTIVVKILPGVMDLAENPFVNEEVVETVQDLKNTASYVHNDSLLPILTIEDFQPNPTNTNGILTYNSNKAGTYYYMIVPNSYNMSNILPRDFYNEFTNQPTLTERIPFLSKQGDTGSNTVNVGSQSQSINLPRPTDPFESYSLYMIMKDRSGQLSSIAKVPNVIDDSRAPFVRSLKVEPQDNNDRIMNLILETNEGGRVYYKRFEANTQDVNELEEIRKIRVDYKSMFSNNRGNLNAVNDETAKQFINEIKSWSSAQLKEGEATVVRDSVAPHTKYLYFIAVEDSVGNITLFPSNLSSPQAGVPEDYQFEVMERTAYSDGTNPKVIGQNLRLLNEVEDYLYLPPASNDTTRGNNTLKFEPQRTFSITFSELISYSPDAQAASPIEYDNSTFNQLASILSDKLGVNVVDMEWHDEDLESWEEHRLIFTVDGDVPSEVVLEKDDFKLFSDLAVRYIIEDVNLKYLPNSDKNGILGLWLNKGEGMDYVAPGSSNKAQSKGINGQIEINAGETLEPRYYYVVQNETMTKEPTAEEIVNYVSWQLSPNKQVFGDKFDLNGLDRTRLGRGNFDLNAGSSFTIELLLTNGRFYGDQKLYLVSVDKYGNILGTTVSNTSGLVGGDNYVVIPNN